MTNASEVDEDFNIFQISTGGNYLVTDEPELISVQPINALDWDPLLSYQFGTYVMYNNFMYVSINKNDPDLDDNLNKRPDLYSSGIIIQDYWKQYEQPPVYQGFYLYSLYDKTYFRASPDV
jgi:hypothetical protein